MTELMTSVTDWTRPLTTHRQTAVTIVQPSSAPHTHSFIHSFIHCTCRQLSCVWSVACSDGQFSILRRPDLKIFSKNIIIRSICFDFASVDMSKWISLSIQACCLFYMQAAALLQSDSSLKYRTLYMNNGIQFTREASKKLNYSIVKFVLILTVSLISIETHITESNRAMFGSNRRCDSTRDRIELSAHHWLYAGADTVMRRGNHRVRSVGSSVAVVSQQLWRLSWQWQWQWHARWLCSRTQRLISSHLAPAPSHCPTQRRC